MKKGEEMCRIALLGTGEMGTRMTRRLLRAGHRVTVYNRTAARSRALLAEGAEVAFSPRDAAMAGDVVISMVTDDNASRAVWLDALPGLHKDAIAIESSTLTPRWVRELSRWAEQRNVRFLDAPVVGSRPQADAGALVYLVGGDADTLRLVRHVLEAMGAIHHVGPTGAGATLKLAVNGLFGCQVAVLAELLGMLRRAGIDEQSAMTLLGTLPVTSPAMQGIGAQIAARAFQPLFPVSLVEKDFRYLIETADALSTTTPACQAVHEVFARARRSGLAELNLSSIARLYE